MSLKINKDNIFFILPEDRYSVSNRIDDWMEKDFVLHISAKIYPENLTDRQSFLIARNGMHSGINCFMDSNNKVNVGFIYWFKNDENQQIPKEVFYILNEKELESFNEYTMICDSSSEKKIDCYVNSKLVGTINFDNDEKQCYENCFYWFGCGSMFAPEEHRGIGGEFEYKLTFCLNKKINIDEVQDIIDNFATKYTIDAYNGLKRLSNDFYLKKNFAFFCDFNNVTRYKVWDMTFTGNYPQLYIENNIYF